MLSSLALLIKLSYQPKSALASLRDSAPYLAGGMLALLATFAFEYAASGSFWVERSARGQAFGDHYSPILITLLVSNLIAAAAPVAFVALVFVPACLFSASLIDRRTSFGVLLRQEYAPLLTCVLYSWALSHLVIAIPAFFLSALGQGDAVVSIAIGAARFGYFLVLVALAFHTVLRLSYSAALGGTVLACVSLIALPLVPRLGRFLTSPMILILVILFLRSYWTELMSSHEGRIRFKQSLETATLNPADATAHYNLGLIYQQRGMNEEAKASFRRAIEIDTDETDAHYQLGRMARAEGRLADAIQHFDAVVRQNSSHSQNEVWREIGRAYLQAGQFEDAADALKQFLDKRPSNAEGRYYYGVALNRLGREKEALVEMNVVIESVRTSPPYKYRMEKSWMREAQSFIANSGAQK